MCECWEGAYEYVILLGVAFSRYGEPPRAHAKCISDNRLIARICLCAQSNVSRVCGTHAAGTLTRGGSKGFDPIYRLAPCFVCSSRPSRPPITRDFFESSSLRINQRHHSLRTRLWYTPPAAVILRGGEHRARVDGRATARHLHGIIARAVRCYTVKVSAESAGAVASNVFLRSLTTRQSGRLAQPDGGAGTPSGRGCHLQGRSAQPSCTTP